LKQFFYILEILVICTVAINKIPWVLDLSSQHHNTCTSENFSILKGKNYFLRGILYSKMSGWDQNFGHQEGFYNPDTSGYYGNFGHGQSQTPAGGVSFMTPAPLESVYDNNFVENDDDFANEPPLLEELGINPDYIVQKTLTVLNPFRTTRPDVAADSDLAGPLVGYFPLLFFFVLVAYKQEEL
jgi:hypothetical protein